MTHYIASLVGSLVGCLEGWLASSLLAYLGVGRLVVSGLSVRLIVSVVAGRLIVSGPADRLVDRLFHKLVGCSLL